MCFGSTTTQTQSTNNSGATSNAGTSNATTSTPAWLQSAGQSNLDTLQSLQAAGFQPYTGNQVAGFSPQQQSSFDLGGNIVNTVSPTLPIAGSALANYTTAGPSSVTALPIDMEMAPYMNQYVNFALAPQLEQLQQNYAAQNKSFDSAATGAGAFGDSSWNLGRTNLTNEQNIGLTGLVGNAYTSAFNTAIGAGAQDVANNLNAQTTNANLNETALNRELTGANAILGANTGATNLANSLGAQQTGMTQAQLNAAYNQWVMAQQYPMQVSGAMDQAIAAGRQAAPISTSGSTTSNGTTLSNGYSQTQAPDNSGWGMLGSLAANAIPALLTGGASLPFTAAANVAAGGFGGTPTQYGSGGMTSMLGPMAQPGGYNLGYAEGGNPPVGKPVVVGERGPEVFTAQKPGTVIPFEQLQAAMAKRKGVKVPPKKAAPSPIATQLGVAA